MSPKTKLKALMRAVVPATVVAFNEISGRDVVTVEVAHTGVIVTFDHSWLPNAHEGEYVALPCTVNLFLPPMVSVKLDYFATPVTVSEEDIGPVRL